jgi:hypothetical protein
MTAPSAETKQKYQDGSLLAEMAAYLRATGADLGDEAACILALTGARFRARDISALLDDAIEAARVARANAEYFPEGADSDFPEHASQSIDRRQICWRSQRRREEA